MNYAIDIIILVCLGWGAYKGFKKGFIIQSFSIIALILGIWSGFTLSGKVAPVLMQHFNIGELACSIVSFVIVFLIVLILVYLTGYIATKLANITTLGLINRLAGATFGMLANAIIFSLMIVLFNKINDRKHFIAEEQLEKTYLYEPVGKLAPFIFPERFFEKVKDNLMQRVL